jgi:hypothetical protein
MLIRRCKLSGYAGSAKVPKTMLLRLRQFELKIDVVKSAR